MKLRKLQWKMCNSFLLKGELFQPWVVDCYLPEEADSLRNSIKDFLIT